MRARRRLSVYGMSDRVPVVIVGGGVVGCAIAAHLASRGLRPWLLEAADRLATGTTARNSGVIHAGLYYPNGSLKAETCVRGARLLVAWCDRTGVPYRRCGKWIVAQSGEEDAIATLHANAVRNGAHGLELADGSRLRRALPDVRDAAGLWSPNTGIVDAEAFARSLAADAERSGATVVCGSAVLAAAPGPDGWRIETARGPVDTAWIVNSAGLFADDVARMCGIDQHRVVPVRGDYFRWRGAPRFPHLVYPAPRLHTGGLGVHVTIDLAGSVRLGPDVQWGVGRLDHAPPADEDARRLAFFTAATAMFPSLRPDALAWDGCGIRPKRRQAHEPEQDFYVGVDAPGLVNLVGIESPGLTAAMALAERVGALID